MVTTTLLLLLVLLAEPSGQQPTQEGYEPEINITNSTGQVVFLWTSISLAVFTSLIQGLITVVIQIAEDQGLWTYRLARYEHWWWTVVSVLLSVSFASIILAFLAGNNQESLGVLALSTATTIAIVRYAVPAWRNRAFVENRWLAWTGPSRTAISSIYKDLCGDKAQWQRLSRARADKRIVSTPSDDWGLAVFPPKGLWENPTAILGKFDEDKTTFVYSKADFPCVYDDGNQANSDVSLLWGEDEGFRRRVSRAINAVPLSILDSRPITVDGYSGEGLCLAFGILGRNKGLHPHTLVFDSGDEWKKHRGVARSRAGMLVHAVLENSSSWAPRLSKVMRSYYQRAVAEQFGRLPADYLAAATELSLILLDIGRKPLRIWLGNHMEQQAIDVNLWMSGRRGTFHAKATDEQLSALYRASYTSMVISLNYLPPSGRATTKCVSSGHVVRPDFDVFRPSASSRICRGPEREDRVVG